MRAAILTIALIAILVAACAPRAQEPTTQVPAQPPANPTPGSETPNPPPDQLRKEPSTRVNPDVEKLFANSANVKSYGFDLALLPDGRARYHYDVRGDRARVTLTDSLRLPGGYVDVVYLDLQNRTAVGYCAEASKACDPMRPVEATYKDFEIVLPQEWIERLRHGAKAGSLTFYNAPVNVVQLEENGTWYEAYVHNYWGMPVRVALAKDKEMSEIVGGYEYRSMTFNNIKDATVTPPTQ